MATEIRVWCRPSSVCVLFTFQSQRKVDEEWKNEMIHIHATHLPSEQYWCARVNCRNEAQTSRDGRRGDGAVHLERLRQRHGPGSGTGVLQGWPRGARDLQCWPFC